jgi:hypothetical protein
MDVPMKFVEPTGELGLQLARAIELTAQLMQPR